MAKTTAIRFLFAKGSTDFGGVAIPLTVTITSFFVLRIVVDILQKVESEVAA